jgi:hypothetical protein
MSRQAERAIWLAVLLALAAVTFWPQHHAAADTNFSQPVPFNLTQVAGTAPVTAGTVDHMLKPDTAAAHAVATATVKTSVTTAVVVKSSAGNLYGWAAQNGATAADCFVEFINASSSPSLGTAAVFSVQMTEFAAAAQQNAFYMLPVPINFSTGISVGFATTFNGSSACGTAGNITIFYN